MLHGKLSGRTRFSSYRLVYCFLLLLRIVLVWISWSPSKEPSRMKKLSSVREASFPLIQSFSTGDLKNKQEQKQQQQREIELNRKKKKGRQELGGRREGGGGRKATL